MTSLLARIARTPKVDTSERSTAIGTWLDQLAYNGHIYPLLGASGTMGQAEPVRYSLRNAIQQHPVVFSMVDKRAETFAQARMAFSRRRTQGLPTVGDLFTTDALSVLDDPMMLLDRMERDNADAGNAFVIRRTSDGIPVTGGMPRREDDHLFRLDPHHVTITFGVAGAPIDPQTPLPMSRLVPLGIDYNPPGGQAEQFLPGEYAHYAPVPDLAMTQRGMSWLEPALVDVDTDAQSREYVRSFYVNGATPNLIVTIDPMIAVEAVERIQEAISENHAGAANAFGTLVLAGGAKPTVVGSALKDLDQEPISRLLHANIAMASGIPPIIGGVPGLGQDTYANTRQAMRAFLDLKMRPLWTKAALALTPLIDVPGGARLWADVSTVAATQDDLTDDAEIMVKKGTYIRSLTDGGYLPESVVASANSGQVTDLEHSGLFSVQQQPPSEAGTMNDDEPDPPMAEGDSKDNGSETEG